MRPAILLSLLFLLLVLSGCAQKPAPAPAGHPGDHSPDSLTLPPNSPKLSFVKIETVTETEGGPAVMLTGRVAFDEDHTQRLASPIDGRATAILVKPGDSVKAGQSIIELSSPRVGQLQSDAEKASEDLAVAEKARDRARKLQQDGAISDKEVAQIEADYEKAKSDVGSTMSQLRALGISASAPTVAVALRSQIPGTVVERNVLVGQEVRADSTAPLLTISDLSSVWVLADVYEQDLKLVQQGDKVAIHVPAYPDQSFPGTVAHIGDVLDPTSHTVKVRCTVPNPGGKLKPEMFAKIELSSATQGKVILVSSKAVLADSEHTRVIVSPSVGVFKMRVVTVGPEMDGKVRVLSGLTPGERIVTEGALFLKGEVEDS